VAVGTDAELESKEMSGPGRAGPLVGLLLMVDPGVERRQGRGGGGGGGGAAPPPPPPTTSWIGSPANTRLLGERGDLVVTVDLRFPTFDRAGVG
jgi:hypothetical protein